MCWKLKWFLITTTKWLFLSLKWQGFWLLTKINIVTTITVDLNRSDLQVCIEIYLILSKQIALFSQQDKLCEWSFIPTRDFSYEFVFWCLVFCGYACKTGDALQAVDLTKPTCRSPCCLGKLSWSLCIFTRTLRELSLNEVTYLMIQSKQFQLLMV